LFKAFPDIHYTIGDMIAEGDKVVIRARVDGTQKEEIFDIKPTGKRLNNVSEIFFFRLKDGKIIEGWRQVDFCTLVKRLQK